MPFSTMLLADYLTYRLAVAASWLNIVLPGALLYAGAVRPASQAAQAGGHRRDDRRQ